MKVFDSVPIKKPAANVFNLSHDVKSSYNFDKIYPFFCELVNPGETFNVSAEVFMRASIGIALMKTSAETLKVSPGFTNSQKKG